MTLGRLLRKLGGDVRSGLVGTAAWGALTFVGGTLLAWWRSAPDALPASLSVGASLATVVMVFRLFRELRRRLPLAPSAVAASRTSHSEVAAIGIVRPVTMSAGPEGDEIEVDCSVHFYGLVVGAKTSPTQLIVSIAQDETPRGVICRLEAVTPSQAVSPGAWQWKGYRGVIAIPGRARLRAAIQKAMRSVPSTGPVFAAVQVGLPDGPALQMHVDSRVLLYPPPEVAGRPEFIVRIENWSDGVPDRWRH